jgi:hypothetical protein
MSKKVRVIFHYAQPRTSTRVVTLPQDWDTYTKVEKNEFFEDECPVPVWELDYYEAVE